MLLTLLLFSTLTAGNVRFIGKTKYLNNARAAVTHTIDDSTRYVPDAIDAMDKYGIKATIFVSTDRGPIAELWPRLNQAIDNGHEIGSHSRRHQCKWPDDENFCASAYSDSEISGSRDDILKKTKQPAVWSWCYPCGNCAGYEFIQKRLSAAGYLVARNYPDEARDGHLVPNVNDFAANPLNAAYTQCVQKKGGIAKSGNTDVATLNARFDEVYRAGGIYNFLSHPQWLDYGPDQFYEQHMAYLARRADVWYVPMGPLYAYRALRDATEVSGRKGRFEVSCPLDPKIYNGSVTLQFAGSGAPHANGAAIPEKKNGLTERWSAEYFRRDGRTIYVTVRPNTTIEFR